MRYLLFGVKAENINTIKEELEKHIDTPFHGRQSDYYGNYFSTRCDVYGDWSIYYNFNDQGEFDFTDEPDYIDFNCLVSIYDVVSFEKNIDLVMKTLPFETVLITKTETT